MSIRTLEHDLTSDDGDGLRAEYALARALEDEALDWPVALGLLAADHGDPDPPVPNEWVDTVGRGRYRLQSWRRA